MNDNKVDRLWTKAPTFRAMAADASTREEAKRGFLIFFEGDGTMHFGEKDICRQDVGMALMYLQMIAVQMMEQKD